LDDRRVEKADPRQSKSKHRRAAPIDRGSNLIRVSRSRHVIKPWQIGNGSA
jgi:hypothetical protein